MMYTERKKKFLKSQINLLSQWQMNFVTEIQLKVVEHNLQAQNTECPKWKSKDSKQELFTAVIIIMLSLSQGKSKQGYECGSRCVVLSCVACSSTACWIVIWVIYFHIFNLHLWFPNHYLLLNIYIGINERMTMTIDEHDLNPTNL